MTAPRVVHVASGREWRGGQRQVWLLARALARAGDVTQVVVTGRGGELARRLHIDGVPTMTPEWTGAFDLRALATAVKATAPGSILHAHDSHALTLAWIASLPRRLPVVATRRVDVPVGRAGFWRRADRVISVSAAVGRALVAGGIPPERISVVPSGINLPETTATVAYDPRPGLGIPAGAPLVIATGALVSVKDHATLVRAAAAARPRRPDLHWAVAGEGHRREALNTLIAELGLEGRVHLLGHVAEAIRLVAAADLFVMPSRWEGLGTSVLDAMALGVPVVGTRVGGIPELLEGGAGLLVESEDPVGMADAVLALLENPARRERQVEYAREVVRRYSDERMAEGVLQVYRSLTSAD